MSSPGQFAFLKFDVSTSDFIIEGPKSVILWSVMVNVPSGQFKSGTDHLILIGDWDVQMYQRQKVFHQLHGPDFLARNFI